MACRSLRSKRREITVLSIGLIQSRRRLISDNMTPIFKTDLRMLPEFKRRNGPLNFPLGSGVCPWLGMKLGAGNVHAFQAVILLQVIGKCGSRWCTLCLTTE